LNTTLLRATLLVFAITATAAGRTGAQTVAAGPYYAVPSWDQSIPCPAPSNCPRFIVLANMSAEAVLDRETGLVWQRSPGRVLLDFDAATRACASALTGGRMGWRLPSLHELQSLLVPKVLPALQIGGRFLDDGHPFIGTLGEFEGYWTNTTQQVTPGMIWTQRVGISFPPAPTFGPPPPSQTSTTGFSYTWCLRGPGVLSVH
jgi:hypothetical protein